MSAPSWVLGEIQKLRRELTAYVDKHFGFQFGWTKSAKSSALGDKDAVETADGTNKARPVRRVEPFGHRGRAPGGVRTFWVRLGSSNLVFLGIASSSKHGPDDLEEGEVAIYSDQIEKALHCTKDGDNKIASKTGRTVQINGDSYSLLKTEDFLSALDDFTDAVKQITADNINFAAYDTAVAAFKTALAGGTYLSEKAKNG